MTKQIPPSIPASIFNKANPFHSSTLTTSLYLDVTDPNARNRITSSFVTICKPTSFPCFALLSLLEVSSTSSHQQFVFDDLSLLFALWSALGEQETPGRPQVTCCFPSVLPPHSWVPISIWQVRLCTSMCLLRGLQMHHGFQTPDFCSSSNNEIGCPRLCSSPRLRPEMNLFTCACSDGSSWCKCLLSLMFWIINSVHQLIWVRYN